MDSFADWITSFIHVIAPGFIYFVLLILLIKLFLKIDLFKKINRNREYLPYVGIVAILSSYIIGYIMYQGSELIAKYLGLSGDSSKINALAPTAKEGYQVIRRGFLMVRHLLFSLLLLSISLWFAYWKKWRKQSHIKLEFYVIFWIIILGLLAVIYFCKLRPEIKEFMLDENVSLSRLSLKWI
ncbi:MAG: hypothetical protein JXC36_03340 [Candidatus Atribacteria bacterium]|nr:hypothetical protein [Candidatus Atribacteria bacterium]